MKTNPFAKWDDHVHSWLSNKFEDWFGYPAWPRDKAGLTAAEIVELNKKQTSTFKFRMLKKITDVPLNIESFWTNLFKT